MPRFGSPLNIRIRSTESVAIIEPTLGLDASQPSVDAPLGSTPASDNYIMREGALEPRPMLSLRNTTPQPLGADPVLGGWDLISVANSRFPIVSGTTRLAAYGLGGNPNGWSALSYVSAAGLNDPPAGSSANYWDFCQLYYPARDEMIAIGANGSYQSLYCTQSDTTVFSSLTGAPRAKYVATFNNYVLTFNSKDGANDLVQRVQWSDRGDPSTWTQGLAGFEDLLDMRGQGTRVLAQENQVVLFSEDEIWRGVERDYPFQFAFQPLDRSVGCPYAWTACQTPLGIIWLGKDYQVYLLPKGGGQAQPIGQRLHRSIRQTIDTPAKAWAVYDHTLSQYHLYYAVKGGSGTPQSAVYLDIQTGSWAPQSFDKNAGGLSLTRGFEVYVSSSATTWGGLVAAGMRWADLNQSWAELQGASEERSILVGSSTGTTYTFSSTATSDNGTAVPCTWRSTGLVGDDPSRQKTMTELRIDYQGESSSSLSVRFSPNVGASFGNETRVDLPATSGLSQAIVHPYFTARYPMFEVSSEGHRYRIFRFWNAYRRSGR